MTAIDKMKTDGTWETLNKRERLFKTRQRDKLQKNFGSIVEMTRQPAAIFIVDILKEHIALNEAKRLKIPTFAMVDTNSNPKLVDFPIPSNDDATKSITIILDSVCAAVKEGLEERKSDKEIAAKDAKIAEAKKAEAKVAETKKAEEKKAEAKKVEVKEVVEATAPVEEKATEEKPKAAKKAPVKKEDDKVEESK